MQIVNNKRIVKILNDQNIIVQYLEPTGEDRFRVHLQIPQFIGSGGAFEFVVNTIPGNKNFIAAFTDAVLWYDIEDEADFLSAGYGVVNALNIALVRKKYLENIARLFSLIELDEDDNDGTGAGGGAAPCKGRKFPDRTHTAKRTLCRA